MPNHITGTPTNVEEFIYQYSTTKAELGELLLADMSTIKANLCILDIGCGIGNILSLLKKQGFDWLYGLEYDKIIAKEAKNRIAESIHIISGDAQKLSFKSNSFDICICYDVIEHVPQPDTTLKEIYRVLKLGGMLYIRFPNGYSLNDYLFRWGGKLLRGRTTHIQQFTKGMMIDRLLPSNNFKVLKVHTSYGCPLVNLPIFKNIPCNKFLSLPLKIMGRSIPHAWEVKALKV